MEVWRRKANAWLACIISVIAGRQLIALLNKNRYLEEL